MVCLRTIGYERFTAEAWLRLLVSHNVDVVVDVRDLPVSRKRGFSKRRLAQQLSEAGVEYVHLKELGNPKHLRDALKDGLDFDEFAETFRDILSTRHDVLRELMLLAEAHSVCLLCYEEDPMLCHRSLVAEVMATVVDDGVDVTHFRLADVPRLSRQSELEDVVSA